MRVFLHIASLVARVASVFCGVQMQDFVLIELSFCVLYDVACTLCEVAC